MFSNYAVAEPLNIQTINPISFTDGEAFGAKNKKQTFNNFTEIPLSKKASIGGIFQVSKIESTHNGSTKDYAINSIELFSRYKILVVKNSALQCIMLLNFLEFMMRINI